MIYAELREMHNSSLKMLSHLAFQCSVSYMSKMFNYNIMSKFKPDTMTCCGVKCNHFYDMIQNYNQEGQDEDLTCKLSFTRTIVT